MLHRPPPSPLFPYTTLFRSSRSLHEGAVDPSSPAARAKLADLLPRTLAAGEDGSTDRKSTRLNSSHSQMSYAVFCLKKKNPPPIQKYSYDATPPSHSYISSS